MATIYMDNVLIFFKSKHDAFYHLQQVLEGLANAGFSFSCNKCKFLKLSVEYLGYVISNGQVSPNPKKVEAFAHAPLLNNVMELRQFIRLAGYFRKFVPNFLSFMAPLYRLTQKNAKWQWHDEHTKTRETVVKHLTSTPLLTIFYPKRVIEVLTDAH